MCFKTHKCVKCGKRICLNCLQFRVLIDLHDYTMTYAYYCHQCFQEEEPNHDRWN
jgi:hypothetical protein